MVQSLGNELVVASDTPATQAAAEMSSETVLDLLTQLALRKRLVATVFAASLGIGLLLGFVLPSRYTAVVEIMPPKQVQSAASFLNGALGLGALAQVGGTSALLTDPNAIYMGLLRSRPIADALIDQFHLAEVYRATDRTDARNRLAARTTIVSEPSTLISIAVTDGDRRRAADLANAYTDQLRLLTRTISVGEAAKRRLFFEEQLATQKGVLVAAEQAFEQVQQSKGLIHLDAQAKVIIGGLAALHAQIATKQVELQGLRSYSTEHNPDVQLAERELSTMQGEAARMEQSGPPGGSSGIALKDVPRMGLEYIRAQRELQYQQALFDMLLRQYEAAKLDEARESAVIQVVQPAVEPDRRSSPKRLAMAAVAGVLGLFSGCLVAMLQHRLERETSDPDGALALAKLKQALAT